MSFWHRFRQFESPLQVTIVYLCAWFVLLMDLRTTQWLPTWLHAGVSAAAIPLLVYWYRRSEQSPLFGAPGQPYSRWFVLTIGYVLMWHLCLVALDLLVLDSIRATVARWGTLALFAIGLIWTVWSVERATKFYSGRDVATDVWNPLDLRAKFYAVDWWPPNKWFSPGQWTHGNRSRKLDQSFLALVSYTFVFLMLGLLFAQLSGCREIYEMPAGGGEQKQLAQVVKIKKVIRKKYVVNPLSAISFEVPPIDEVQLKLEEITEHAYTVGYGEGKGAGFSEGTFRGKVRFIRIEYSGGDWDQDFGVGGDLNMLLEYGIRTQHQVGERTESRTISQLRNFPKGKSPPIVYLTGQQNISLSSSEVKTLREYLIDKHGMLFGDNGGSRHFHNQFVAMMNRVVPEIQPVPIPLDDTIHRIPYQIPFLPYVAPHGGKEALGWYKDGRWIAYYHPGDIGDAWSDGHAGVKADIWESCYQLGTNVIFYAHADYSKWLEAQKKE
ncbi:MAG: DUF4159 domain-containing protein [Pirellulaceae bacterium]|nr:DUF4159 domain-containing protein [Pirellulaceae bacterium]